MLELELELELNRLGRWQGSHTGRVARSSPPPSQGLRKRHCPSGEVQVRQNRA